MARWIIAAAALAMAAPAAAQGMYANPILFADYSDPDVIRVGQDYYLVASSFHFSPGLPVLHSRDLIHWTIIGHVLPRLPFGPEYDMGGPQTLTDAVSKPIGGTRYGRGVTTPSSSTRVPSALIRRVQDSDEFSSRRLGLQWSWNHNPVDRAWSLGERRRWLRLRGLPSGHLVTARNTLTQVLWGPSSRVTAAGQPIQLAKFSWWKGSRPALFSFTRGKGQGWADVDWVHVEHGQLSRRP